MICRKHHRSGETKKKLLDVVGRDSEVAAGGRLEVDICYRQRKG